MQVKEISGKDWNQLAAQADNASVFGQQDVVAVIADVFAVKPIYFIVVKKDRPIFGLLVYARGNKIIHPLTDIYTALWQYSLSPLGLQQAWLVLIKHLQRFFVRIDFILPISIQDIRPFIYQGFKADVKYTYINNFSHSYANELQSLWRKANRMGVNFAKDDAETYIKHVIKGFDFLPFGKSDKLRLEKFIYGMHNIGKLNAVGAFLDGKLIASALSLIDKKEKVAYNLFVSSHKANYHTGVHTALYLENFNQLKQQGVCAIDLCGATAEGVGNFKAGFNGELNAYYHVRYNKWRWQAVKWLKLFKLAISKLGNL